MNIAHISLFPKFLPGFAVSLNAEADAISKKKSQDKWDVYIVSGDKPPANIHPKIVWQQIWIPRIGRNITDVTNPFLFYMLRILTINFLFLRVFFNLKINKLTQIYDFVVVRYNPADILAWIFLKRKDKIIFMYHTKPSLELKLYSKIGAVIELLTAKFQAYGCKYLASVTPEIGNYQKNILKANIKIIQKPNGIKIKNYSIYRDERDPKVINLIMVASNFSDWIGLDILISKMREKKINHMPFKVHLVGKLSKLQTSIVSQDSHIISYGILDRNEILGMYKKMDLGIGSLAFFRSGLKEASSIKVKEYLNNGVSCIVTHREINFPVNFKFILELKNEWTFEEILKYAKYNKKHPKEIIVKSSQRFINQQIILENFLTQLKHNEENK